LTLHGSQAYGLANELSDVDVKGVCVPPREVEADLFQRFEQAENDKAVEAEFSGWKNPKNPKFESVVYSLRKFFILAAGVNPNIIEVLWTEPDSWLIRSEWAYRLMDLRHKFLSTKSKYTFSGYAYSQLAKIERHRKWIVQGELEQPKREDFGLPPVMARGTEEIFSYIKARVEQWNLNQFPLEESARADLKETIWDLIHEVSQVEVSWDNWPDVYADAAIQKMAGELNLKDEVVHLINAERAYNKAKKNFESWLSWKKERNPARRLLEVKCGYDSKHASHLVRLMRMGKEILLTGKVTVKRPDAEELLFIKNGGWSYERVVEYAETLQRELDEEYKKMEENRKKGVLVVLPKTVNFVELNKIYHQFTEDYQKQF